MVWILWKEKFDNLCKSEFLHIPAQKNPPKANPNKQTKKPPTYLSPPPHDVPGTFLQLFIPGPSNKCPWTGDEMLQYLTSLPFY